MRTLWTTEHSCRCSSRLFRILLVWFGLLVVTGLATDVANPLPRWNAASALASDGSVAYLYGGATSHDNASTDLFNLSLTSSWSLEQPPWRMINAKNSHGNTKKESLGPEQAIGAVVTVQKGHGRSETSDSIVVFGGVSASGSDKDAGIWTFENMRRWEHGKVGRGPRARSFAAYQTDINGTLWMFGGTELGKHATDLNDTWSFRNGVWTQYVHKKGPTARRDATMTITVEGRAFLVGGYQTATAQLVPLTEIWHFDTTKPKKGWQRSHAQADLIAPRRQHIAAALNQTALLVHGGANSELNVSYADVAVLNTSTRPMTWSSIKLKSSNKRDNDRPGGVYGHTGVVTKGVLLVIGGRHEQAPVRNLYALSLSNWSWLTYFAGTSSMASSALTSTSTALSSSTISTRRSHIIVLSSFSPSKTAVSTKKTSRTTTTRADSSNHAKSTRTTEGIGQGYTASVSTDEVDTPATTYAASVQSADTALAAPLSSTSASTALANNSSSPAQKAPIVVGSIVGSIALAVAAAAATLVLRRHSTLKTATLASQRLQSDSSSQSEKSSGRGSILGPLFANRVKLHPATSENPTQSPLSPQIWDSGHGEQWQSLDLGPAPLPQSRSGSPERPYASTPILDYGVAQSRHRLHSVGGAVGFVGIAVAAAGAVEVVKRSGIRAAHRLFGYKYDDNLTTSNAAQNATERTRSWRHRFNRNNDAIFSAQAFPFPLSAPVSPAKKLEDLRKSSAVLQAMADGEATITSIPWLENEDGHDRYPKQMSPRLGMLAAVNDRAEAPTAISRARHLDLSSLPTNPFASSRDGSLEADERVSAQSTPFSEVLEEQFGTMDVQISGTRLARRQTSQGSQHSSNSAGTSEILSTNAMQESYVRRRSSARTISGRSITSIEHPYLRAEKPEDPMQITEQGHTLRPTHKKSTPSRDSLHATSATRRSSSRFRAVTVKKSQIFVANPDSPEQG